MASASLASLLEACLFRHPRAPTKAAAGRSRNQHSRLPCLLSLHTAFRCAIVTRGNFLGMQTTSIKPPSATAHSRFPLLDFLVIHAPATKPQATLPLVRVFLLAVFLGRVFRLSPGKSQLLFQKHAPGSVEPGEKPNLCLLHVHQLVVALCSYARSKCMLQQCGWRQ